MKLQRLLSLTRQAVDHYNMIEEGDRVALGMSGGKDSLTLLYALCHLQKFYPKHFDLCAITVDLGLGNLELDPIRALCEEFAVPYEVVPTQIGKVLFETRKESNPCSLCAKMRKGALNNKALEFGCNKVAYAHHRDDLIETALMSLIYEGHFYAFSPRTKLDRTGLTVIRPLLYASEAEVVGFKNKYHLPVCKNPCPMDGHTKREYVKNLIRDLQRDNPTVKDCLFHAVVNGKIEGWPDVE
ncbi:tRNA lysidine(34) synthetase [Enterocloster asparagiformis]|uniref:tRNA lysidine(34) synthetase n=1 Tax=Enterocloster asparagiformis TaxID=333367 RepID=UPI000465ABFE|nr:tRNA 2-thiocytidine biosynthesis TtcA family protein [Enterocloster asparagiformis]